MSNGVTRLLGEAVLKGGHAVRWVVGIRPVATRQHWVCWSDAERAPQFPSMALLNNPENSGQLRLIVWDTKSAAEGYATTLAVLTTVPISIVQLTACAELDGVPTANAGTLDL